MIKWMFSPSYVEQFFAKDGCERALLVRGMGKRDRKRLGWEIDYLKNISIQQAGEKWEEKGLEILKNRGEKIYISPTDKRIFDIEATKKILQGFNKAGKGTCKVKYIYQPTVTVTNSFIDQYFPYLIEGMSMDEKCVYKYQDKLKIEFANARPDILVAEWKEDKRKWVISVIDFKNAKKFKLEHKVQVALYVLMLENMINELIIDGVISECVQVNTDSAYIWNKGKEEPTEFELGQVFVFLKDFLCEKFRCMVKKIIKEDRQECLLEKLEYNMCQKCEWCDNYSYCKKWAKDNAPMVLSPYLTPHGQRFIKALNKTVEDNILDIDSFKTYAETDEGKKTLEQSMYWKKFIKNLDDSTQMLTDAVTKDKSELVGTFREKDAAILGFPKYENMTIVMTAQRDENFDRVYAYGLNISIWSNDKKIFRLDGDYGDNAENVEALKNLCDRYCNKENKDICLNISQNPYEDSEPEQTDSGTYKPQKLNVEIIVKNPDVFDMGDELFVRLLHGYLKNIDAHNCQCEDFKKKIGVQAYVMDNYELNNITDMLFSKLGSNNTISIEHSKLIFDILFWLQGQELVTSSCANRPYDVVNMPVVVLSSVINRLYSFPSQIGNRLVDVVNYLNVKYQPCTAGVLEKTNDYECIGKLSNVFNNDIINQYWRATRKTAKIKKNIDTIGEHLRLRLMMEKSLIEHIRGINGHSNVRSIITYANKFEFISSSTINNKFLSRLEFEAKYESLMNYNRVRAARAYDVDEAIENGKVMHVRCRACIKKPQPNHSDRFIYTCEFDVLNSESIFEDDKFALVFVPYDRNDVNGEVNKLRAIVDNTYAFSNVCLHKTGRIVTPDDRETQIMIDGGRIRLRCTFKTVVKDQLPMPWDPIEVNKEYLVYDYFREYNLDKNLAAIKWVDRLPEEEETLANNLDDISKYYAETGENYETDESKLLSYGKIGSYTFSPSQQVALKQLYENNITLLLGPPGTGKTDFISRAVLTLCRKYSEEGKQLRVLITANSHSAIENVLASISKKVSDNTCMVDVDICKAGRFDTGGCVGNVNLVTKDDIVKSMTDIDKPYILGSTCWSLNKDLGGENISNYFDLIIIDEASQFRMVDAIIPFSYGYEKSRYLIVGDENQLAPIIQGKYEVDETIPNCYGSVFKYFYDCCQLKKNAYGESISNNDMDYQRILTENYRMNDALVQYSASVIYGDEYKAPIDSIANQKLHLVEPVRNFLKGNVSLSDQEIDALDNIIDPEYPLVMCMVNDESCVNNVDREVRWVKLITRVLENTLSTNQEDDTNPELYDNQKDFWGDSTNEGAFGIISPHHSHIFKLKKAISNTLNDELWVPWGEEMREDLYIGTVDKLQGKQRQAVIVSYGVANVERALAEGEFIHSLNRLNVSLTRGKKKTIIFLSKALLEYPIEALGYEDKAAIDGINFMCGFYDFMKENGDNKSFDDGKLSVYRYKK